MLFYSLNTVNMSTPDLVYQVRSVTPSGAQTVIHAYETEDDAKQAIAVMKARTRKRYTYVQVENDPNQFWGINRKKSK